MANEWIDVGQLERNASGEWLDISLLKRWGDPSTATGGSIGSGGGASGKYITSLFKQYQRYVYNSNSKYTDQTTHKDLEDGKIHMGNVTNRHLGSTTAQDYTKTYDYWGMTDGYNVIKCKGASGIECNVVGLSASGFTTNTPKARLIIKTEEGNIGCATEYQAITTTGLFRGSLSKEGSQNLLDVDNPDSLTHICVRAAISAGSHETGQHSYSTHLYITDLRFI